MFRKLKFFFKELYKASKSIFTSLKKYEYDDLYYLSKLSKCCHILDKGCYTFPFQKGHSVGIYNEAIHLINEIHSELYINDPCYIWCKERINKYEAMQKSDSQELPKYLTGSSYSDSKNYTDFIKSTISVRRFSSDTIKNEIITNCISTAQAAASSCFRQTTRCYAIKSKTMIEKLSNNIAGLTGFSNGVPLLFCITSDTRPYFFTEKDLNFFDAALFSQNLVLALRAHNVYSVFLSFQLATKLDVDAVKQALSIPEYEKIIIFIACGFSNCVSSKPIRMNSDKIFHLIDND